MINKLFYRSFEMFYPKYYKINLKGTIVSIGKCLQLNNIQKWWEID